MLEQVSQVQLGESQTKVTPGRRRGGRHEDPSSYGLDRRIALAEQTRDIPVALLVLNCINKLSP